jgi:hypothetical protein
MPGQFRRCEMRFLRLSTAVLVVLSIFLRFRGSPESKPVGSRNDATGE